VLSKEQLSILRSLREYGPMEGVQPAVKFLAGCVLAVAECSDAVPVAPLTDNEARRIARAGAQVAMDSGVSMAWPLIIETYAQLMERVDGVAVHECHKIIEERGD